MSKNNGDINWGRIVRYTLLVTLNAPFIVVFYMGLAGFHFSIESQSAIVWGLAIVLIPDMIIDLLAIRDKIV